MAHEEIRGAHRADGVGTRRADANLKEIEKACLHRRTLTLPRGDREMREGVE